MTFGRTARLGKTEKIELVDVFRYTPQITQALSSIDKGFPGEDLDSDWPAYSGIAKTNDGPVPIVCELKSRLATYGVVFKRASSMQSRLGTKKRVALLCCSYDAFKWYLDCPELRGDFYAITSRDESLGIPHTARKFVFSMPEYVAGLQYDTVLLIDVNRGEVPDGPYSAAALRNCFPSVSRRPVGGATTGDVLLRRARGHGTVAVTCGCRGYYQSGRERRTENLTSARRMGMAIDEFANSRSQSSGRRPRTNPRGVALYLCALSSPGPPKPRGVRPCGTSYVEGCGSRQDSPPRPGTSPPIQPTSRWPPGFLPATLLRRDASTAFRDCDSSPSPYAKLVTWRPR